MPTPSQLSPATPSFHPDTHRGTAFEQASAAGLTLSERYQKLMESVYTPICLSMSNKPVVRHLPMPSERYKHLNDSKIHRNTRLLKT